ncbi:MAG TPA: hypothetical protein VHN14_27395 [Kofleriaceae bacterium]|jgi:hypothetical protein|nr:hypothetical protein [Kofleriaceae bacterium]
MKLTAFIPVVLMLAACPDRSISSVVPQQQGAVLKHIPVSADIDILFVIDNSASTADKQILFANNFPKFVEKLDAFPTGRPNIHMAVVNTTVDIGVPGYGPGCPSPDPADNGVFQNTPRVTGCNPPNGQFISDVKSTMTGLRTPNYTGTLDQAFSCIAQLGATGCGFEAPLEAMKRALDGSRPENAGFIRNGAYLAVIFLTDEDDASVKDNAVFSLPDAQVGGRSDYRVQPLFAYKCDQPLSTQAGTFTNCKPRTDSYLQDPSIYAQFLSGVKNPAQIVVAAIAAPPPGLMTNDNPSRTADTNNIQIGSLPLNGTTQSPALLPSCSTTINTKMAIGRPAVRLANFISNFGDRGRFYTVCQDDYSAALADIGNTLFNAISPCLEGPVDPTDVDAKRPGLQPQCTVTEVLNAGTDMEVATQMPACEMQDATTPAAGGARPCWWVDQNPTSCPAPDTGLEMNFERTTDPAAGTAVQVECVVIPK